MTDLARQECDTPLHTLFADFERSQRFVVVHCWAKWNGYDVSMRRFLEELPPAISHKVALGRLDFDTEADPGFVREYRIGNLPALLLFRDGHHVHTHIGLCTPSRIENMLRDLIAGSSW
ncbi:MAG: thioredoxin family protein [Bryobacterales bacterium]|nr:thioredoxin family protein [Bryobacterales bacterium]